MPTPSPYEVCKDTKRDSAFWRAHGGVGLVWSNPDASDTIMIRHALVRPKFDLLLAIADHFGIERLKNEWAFLRGALAHTPLPEDAIAIQRATRSVEDCLARIEQVGR